MTAELRAHERAVEVMAEGVALPGILGVPQAAKGIVLFAHGSGSGRFSPRNTFVAHVLQDAGLATLLADLLTEEEADDRRLVFDIGLLAERLTYATQWLGDYPETESLPLGYFGASTGAGAALLAAAQPGSRVRAVVSRGGRPDLVAQALPLVQAPTLLIVGGRDQPVMALNEEALALIRCEKQMIIVPGATHLFEEPGTLEQVAEHARDWFARHLAA